MLDIPCVIFAGGRSSRMGEDKSLLPFGTSATLTEFQHTRLSKIFKTVYISCKNRDKFSFDANFIEDSKTDATFVPTAGFIATFKTLQVDAFFAISVDAPFINARIITRLTQEDAKEYDATIAMTQEGVQPLCGIYHRSLEKEFCQMQKEQRHKLRFLLKNSNTNFVAFKDATPFLNINHPSEYQEALRLLNA